jgi:hypothetical protein
VKKTVLVIMIEKDFWINHGLDVVFRVLFIVLAGMVAFALIMS